MENDTVFEKTRVRILATARQAFISNGYRHVTTSAIAAAAGISKKTLYHHFSSKQALLAGVMRYFRQEASRYVDNLLADGRLNAIDKIRAILSYLGRLLAQVNGPLLADLPRFAPGVWREMQAFRKHKIETGLEHLFHQGVAQGLLREDVPLDILLAMYLHAIQGMINGRFLGQVPYTADKVLQHIVAVFIQGVGTAKGRQLFAEQPILKEEQPS